MPDYLEQPQVDEASQLRIQKASEKRIRPYIEEIASVRTKDELIQRKQVEILKQLPDFKNFSRILKAGLKATRIEYSNNTVPDSSIIQGILFEELVKIENNLYDLSSDNETINSKEKNYTNLEKGKIELDMDEQLVTLFHNPNRFNYGELSHLRNPDLSFVETDVDGKVLRVIGVGEAKSSSKLDTRCFLQFKAFHNSLVKVSDFINQRADCEEHGLKHFGKGEDKTSIVVNDEKEFNQYLIVTSDMDIDAENPARAFKTTGEGALNEHDATNFEKMIKEGKIIIKKSSFSHTELKVLSEKVEQIIAQDMRIEMQEYLAEQQAV